MIENCIDVQQVPEEVERVIVGIEAYLSIRRRGSDTGLSVFKDSDSSGKAHSEKVNFLNIERLTYERTVKQER